MPHQQLRSNWSAWGRTYTKARSRLSLEAAQKQIFVKANSTLAGSGDGDGDEDIST
jgi:hypothetical protein